MKKTIATLLAAVIAVPAFAQHKHLHVYRQDGKFTTKKIENIDKTVFLSTEWGDNNNAIEIHTKDGKKETISESAIDSIVIGHNVPVIYVNLTDYPNISDLYKGNGFTKSTIYDATISMDGNGFFDDLPETKVEFRGRGNSTWNMPKTPYRFKFEKKRELCGMKKAKSFALIANYLDPTLMRNAIAFKIAQMQGIKFSNHCIPVEVYLNGNYRGAYFLTEKIGIGGGSVDIDEEKGMLFELDSYYDEDYKFRYSWSSGPTSAIKSIPVMVKDPDLGELEEDLKDQGFVAKDYFKQWQADMTNFCDAVTKRDKSESLQDVLDIESFANYLLVYVVTCNREIRHPKSTYLYKEGLGSDYVYHFGPAWDFDWAYTYDGYEGAVAYNRLLLDSDGDTNGGTFFRTLAQNEEVRKLFDEKWEKFYAETWPQILDYMEEYAAHIEPSAINNGSKWTGASGIQSSYKFRKRYDTLREWLINRVEWINTHQNHGLY